MKRYLAILAVIGTLIAVGGAVIKAEDRYAKRLTLAQLENSFKGLDTRFQMKILNDKLHDLYEWKWTLEKKDRSPEDDKMYRDILTQIEETKYQLNLLTSK